MHLIGRIFNLLLGNVGVKVGKVMLPKIKLILKINGSPTPLSQSFGEVLMDQIFLFLMISDPIVVVLDSMIVVFSPSRIHPTYLSKGMVQLNEGNLNGSYPL